MLLVRTSLFVALAMTSFRLLAGEANPEPAYVLTIEAQGALHSGDSPVDGQLAQKAEFHYRCISRGELLALYQVSHYFKKTMNGRLVEESTADKDKLVKTTAAGKQELLVAKAPQTFRDYIAAVFEQPVCVLTLDADGKTEKITIPESPASKEPQTLELAKSLQYFHVQFPANKEGWEEERSLSFDQERLTGTLKYEIHPPADASPDIIPVAVSGTLTSTLTGKNGDVLNLTYTLSGEQRYDRAAKQWISGKHELKFTSTPAANNKIAGSYTGTMTITLASDAPGK